MFVSFSYVRIVFKVCHYEIPFITDNNIATKSLKVKDFFRTDPGESDEIWPSGTQEMAGI